MSEYTKGPWELVNSFGIYSLLGADSGDGVPADHNDGWHIANIGDCPTLVDGIGTNLGYSVQTANARLICAAPDLLEALELIVREKVVSADGELGKVVFAAIAKAGGEK